MAIENLQEVQTYLTTNNVEGNEVKTYLDGFKVQPTLENFKTKLNDADFKSFMDSENDKHSSKSLETWKTNNLDKLYQERFIKENPTANPQDLKYNALMAEFEAMKNESSRKDLTNKALKLAEQKKLPASLIDFFVGIDEETTTKNLEVLESVFGTQVEAIVTERLKGKTPGGGGAAVVGMTYEELLKNAGTMSREDLNIAWDKLKK